jgi:hypothetical protein
MLYAEKVPSPSPVIAPPIVIPPSLVFAEIIPVPVLFNVPKFPVVIEPVSEDSISITPFSVKTPALMLVLLRRLM